MCYLYCSLLFCNFCRFFFRSSCWVLNSSCYYHAVWVQFTLEKLGLPTQLAVLDVHSPIDMIPKVLIQPHIDSVCLRYILFKLCYIKDIMDIKHMETKHEIPLNKHEQTCINLLYVAWEERYVCWVCMYHFKKKYGSI